MRPLILSSLCVAVLTSQAFSAKKPLDWQTGKVLDMNRNGYLVGTYRNTHAYGTANASGNYGSYQGTRYGSATNIYRVCETFAIEGNTEIYIASERLRWRWSKPIDLTVNAPVRFAVRKQKLFVVANDGKEHEMHIAKVILRKPQAASSAPVRKMPTWPPLTNQDILKLKQAGLSDSLIIEKIKTSLENYKLGTIDLVALKKAGLSNAVIGAMMAASNR